MNLKVYIVVASLEHHITPKEGALQEREWKMGNLVFLEPNKIDSVPFTTSDVIAQYAKIQHHTVTKLIQKYENDISEYGRVRFKIDTLQTKGGMQEFKIYQLNEEQATLIIIYLKNTEPVRAFKKNLVRQFYLMRAELQKRQLCREQLKPHPPRADRHYTKRPESSPMELQIIY